MRYSYVLTVTPPPINMIRLSLLEATDTLGQALRFGSFAFFGKEVYVLGRCDVDDPDSKVCVVRRRPRII